MNIHPLFVHFPIALLTLYALFEIFIPIKIKAYKLFKWEHIWTYKLLINPIWENIKAFLVIVGTILALPTLQTGEWAEGVIRGASSSPRAFEGSSVGKLIEMHSTFADVTVIVFSILAVGYLARFLWQTANPKVQKFVFINTIQNIVLNKWIAPILALVGLIAVTITGALGGAITYGPDVDPVVKLIYGWFF